MNKAILLSTFLLAIKVASATVVASVDHSQLSQGQSLTLTIELPASGDSPDLTELNNNFEVIGTSTSSQTSIINGQTSSQNTLSINLIPRKPGKQLIPALKVGHDLTTPIPIEVALANNNHDQLAKNSRMFMDATLAKPTTYVGVPVLYSLKFYYSVAISNLSINPIEAANISIQPQGKAIQYQATVEGKNYQVIEQKILITPNRAGDLRIPPATIRGVTTDGQNNDFFAMAINPKPFAISSKGLNLKVKPIPAELAASDWLPAQQLSLSESWSAGLAASITGQPLTRTIILQARGIPASSVPDLSFATPEGFNSYPDKPQTDTTSQDEQLVTTKSFKIAYIPTRPGTVTFPEIKVKWWDLSSDKLKVATIPSKTITVLPEHNQSIGYDSTPKNQARITNAAAKPQTNKLWYYLAISFAALWLATLVIGYLLYKRKARSAISSAERNLKPVATPKHVGLSKLHKACQEKNLQELNLALIEWAAFHWKSKVYTVSDIKELANSPQLDSLIEEINSALYHGQVFYNFAAVEQHITALSEHKSPAKAVESELGTLYPK